MRPYRPLKKVQPRVGSSAPRLSLCMIVKNEAATLDKCLSLARPHVDEIVVIDTGSTDGTQDIARRYADVYDEIAWPGSFAEARNYSLDKATGTHILILDGDEWIEGEESWALVRAAIRQSDLLVAMLPVRNLLGDGLLDSDRFYQERIYPNHELIRYDGRVHNQIVDRIDAYHRRFGGRPYTVEAEITHVGYSYEAARKKEKYAPRVALMERERDEATDAVTRAYYTFQLAVVLVIMEDYARVLSLARELDFSELTDQNAYYARQIIAEAAFKEGQPGLAAVHGDAMLQLDRNEPVGYFITGLALIMVGHRPEGLVMLAEAGRVNERCGQQARFRLNLSFVLNKLHELFEKMKLPQQALLFKKVADSPDHTRAFGDALLEQLQRELLLGDAA